jgi:hypothetical protein
MKALLCLLRLVVAVPAYAGHGSIEETDECFVVEWHGDASDKAADVKQKVLQDAGAAPVKQQMATALPGTAVAPVKQQAAVPARAESRRHAPAAPAARANDDSALRRSRSLRNAIPE